MGRHRGEHRALEKAGARGLELEGGRGEGRAGRQGCSDRQQLGCGAANARLLWEQQESMTGL